MKLVLFFIGISFSVSTHVMIASASPASDIRNIIALCYSTSHDNEVIASICTFADNRDYDQLQDAFNVSRPCRFHNPLMNKKIVRSMTMLHAAAYRGRIQVLQLLLDKGCNPNVVPAVRNKSQEILTPLEAAAIGRCSYECMEELVMRVAYTNDPDIRATLQKSFVYFSPRMMSLLVHRKIVTMTSEVIEQSLRALVSDYCNVGNPIETMRWLLKQNKKPLDSNIAEELIKNLNDSCSDGGYFKPYFATHQQLKRMLEQGDELFL